MSEKLIKRAFIFSSLFLFISVVFLYGVVSARLGLWPYPLLDTMRSASLSLIRYGQLVPQNRLVSAPDTAARELITRHNPSAQLNGYYAIMGYDDELLDYAAWLYDETGNLVHKWILDYDQFDPDGPSGGSDAPHAFKVLADGSVIVNFDQGDVMAKVDQCSQTQWIKQGNYHHSMELAEDGSIWTWRGDGTAYGHYQYINNFNAETGETIKEIGLIEDVISNMGSVSTIFAVRPSYQFERFKKASNGLKELDIFHPNDISILSSSMADQFKNFETGDLLLSFREIHLVAVLDQNTYEIKWASNGPWRYQHDPDFVEDGTISVYNNNTSRNRSEIIKIDPVTGKYRNELYNSDFFFYSAYQGKHQYLPNGNIFIVIPGEGRAVEVTRSGDLVFEINNLSSISPDYNEHLANGIWLPVDYFTSIPNCRS